MILFEIFHFISEVIKCLKKSIARKDDAMYYSLTTGVSMQDRPKSVLDVHNTQ